MPKITKLGGHPQKGAQKPPKTTFINERPYLCKKHTTLTPGNNLISLDTRKKRNNPSISAARKQADLRAGDWWD